MPIYALGASKPTVAASAWLAPTAQLIGNVRLDDEANVWFNAVLRADNDLIHVGAGSNVQDGAVLHTDPGLELLVGKNVVIGHQAMLHGCTVGDNSLIGIQAIVMNGAHIGVNSVVAAGSLVTQGKTFPDGVLIMGSPAKVVKTLDENELAHLKVAAHNYVKKATVYKEQFKELPIYSRGT